MNYALCHLSVIPLRETPCDKSQMVSQVLFGEHFTLLEKDKNWLKIKLYFDDYEGFIDAKQCILINKKHFKELCEQPLQIAIEKVNFIKTLQGDSQIISLGTTLPFYKKKQIQIDRQKWIYEGKITTGKKDRDHIVKTALAYLNAPYVWGGKSIFGIDCSGFTQMVYKINGYKLFRDAYQQALQGANIPLKTSKQGDLAFFQNKENSVIHVGIVMNNQKIIHAHGKVRIDSIDEKGIYNVQRKMYTHNLHSLKRIILKQ